MSHTHSYTHTHAHIHIYIYIYIKHPKAHIYGTNVYLHTDNARIPTFYFN